MFTSVRFSIKPGNHQTLTSNSTAMHEALFRYITHYAKASLSGEEKELVKRAFLPKKLRKKQYFL